LVDEISGDGLLTRSVNNVPPDMAVAGIADKLAKSRLREYDIATPDAAELPVDRPGDPFIDDARYRESPIDHATGTSNFTPLHPEPTGARWLPGSSSMRTV